MLTSSYLNAADPNSMRNHGPTRNAIFNYVLKTPSDSVSRAATASVAESSEFSGYPSCFYGTVKTNDYTKNISQPIFYPGAVF